MWIEVEPLGGIIIRFDTGAIIVADTCGAWLIIEGLVLERLDETEQCDDHDED